MKKCTLIFISLLLSTSSVYAAVFQMASMPVGVSNGHYYLYVTADTGYFDHVNGPGWDLPSDLNTANQWYKHSRGNRTLHLELTCANGAEKMYDYSDAQIAKQGTILLEPPANCG